MLGSTGRLVEMGGRGDHYFVDTEFKVSLVNSHVDIM